MSNVKNIFAWTLLVGITLILGVSLADDEKESIAVTMSVKGTVEFRTVQTDWKPLKFGVVFKDGDIVRTGPDGFASIVFTDDKTELKVRPKTEITLNAERNADFNLSKKIGQTVGELFVSARQPKGYIQVESPLAVATVKGTEFVSLVRSTGDTRIVTLEGVVELKRKDNQQVIEVAAGRRGTAYSDGRLIEAESDPANVPNFQQDSGTGGDMGKSIEILFENDEGEKRRVIIEVEEEE